MLSRRFFLSAGGAAVAAVSMPRMAFARAKAIRGIDSAATAAPLALRKNLRVSMIISSRTRG